MPKLIHLFLDNTFEEKNIKSTGNTVKISDKQSPEFIEGKSIFKERSRPFWQFWRARRSLIFYVDQSLKCWYLDGNALRTPLFGTLEELQAYVAREVAKAGSKKKAIETWQFIVLLGVSIVIIVLQLKMMGFFGYG